MPRASRRARRVSKANRVSKVNRASKVSRAGQQGQQGQGQQGQQGQQGGGRGGDPEGDPRQADQAREGGPRGGATRGNPEPLSDEEIRQYTREFAQRLAQARELQDRLEEEGRDIPELEEAIDALDELRDPETYGDLPQIAALQEQLRESLRRLEFLLRREVEGDGPGRAALTGSDEVPAGFRQMVEEYFRNLARRGGGGGGGAPRKAPDSHRQHPPQGVGLVSQLAIRVPAPAVDSRRRRSRRRYGIDQWRPMRIEGRIASSPAIRPAGFGQPTGMAGP